MFTSFRPDTYFFCCKCLPLFRYKRTRFAPKNGFFTSSTPVFYLRKCRGSAAFLPVCRFMRKDQFVGSSVCCLYVLLMAVLAFLMILSSVTAIPACLFFESLVRDALLELFFV